MRIPLGIALVVAAIHQPPAWAAIPAVPDAGPAQAAIDGGQLVLQNKTIACRWATTEGCLRPVSVTDKLTKRTIAFGNTGAECFQVTLADGTVLNASSLTLGGPIAVQDLKPEPQSSNLARHFAGKQLVAKLATTDGSLVVEWRAVLRDGSNYVRQEIALTATKSDVPIKEIVLVRLPLPEAKTVGVVDGSPVVAGNFFAGYEHPLVNNRVGELHEVGTWTPEQMSWPERKQLEWKLTDQLEAAGPFEVIFQYKGGNHRLDVFWAAVLEDGREVARDEHFGHTGSVDVDNHYRFTLAAFKPGAKYTLRAETRSDQGTDSRGVIQIVPPGTAAMVQGTFLRNAPLKTGETLTQSSVIGIVPHGQLRRGFLNYIERERTHPYRPFLHYNSWYDIAWGNRKFTEAESVDAIQFLGRELVEKRSVTMQSFLMDDGWDDNKTLWKFHDGFPNGFTPLKIAAEKLGGEVGVWLSPFGGYGDARNQRLEYGRQQGFETNASGFSLAGPKYYARFREICLEMIQEYGVNQFKFDGLAAKAGQDVIRDGDAMLRLIAELRAALPDLFINQTTGTWPSPFWLLHVDSTWRGGYDHSFAGAGSPRQQWINYRDGQTYRGVVQRGPLYPVSSLMIHGILFATNAGKLNKADEKEFADEVRTYFGSGTQLQELYITPKLLNAQNWDDLAEAAKWSQANADVLVDTHWIGGDPNKGEVYGWASWTPRKGILVLRNPTDQPAKFTAEIATLFELPATASRTYRLRSPWKADRKQSPVTLRVGRPSTFELQPFEVRALETF